MGMERDILKALQTGVGQAVATSALAALPIKYLGRTFAVPNDQKYLEIVHLPNNRLGDFWNGERIYRGTMRLILHWQNNDAGAYAPTELIEQIGSWFNKDKTLRSGQAAVKIYENPDCSGVIETGTEALYPVSIRYQCFAAE